MRELREQIRQAAVELGFIRVGFAPATPIARDQAFQQWLDRGMDATIHLGDRGSQEWAAVAESWKDIGATHGTIRTMYSGFTTLDEHLEALRSFRNAVPL